MSQNEEKQKLADLPKQSLDGVEYGSVPSEEISEKNNPKKFDPEKEILVLPSVCAPSDIIKQIGFGWYQLRIILILFMAFAGEHALMDMIPVLSTRLYVELDLTAEREANLGVVTFAGLTFSYMVNGVIADKIGRKWSTIFSSVWVIFWNVLCAASYNYATILSFRLIYSFGSGGIHSLQPYVYEILSPEHVWIGILIAHFGGEAFGRLLSYAVAMFVLQTGSNSDWRFFIVLMTIPSFVYIVLSYFLFHETPRYLLAKGKYHQALEVLHKMADKNGKALPQDLEIVQESELAASEDDNTSFKEKFLIFVENKTILRTVICLILIGITVEYISNEMGYVATELVYMNGQTEENYCKGSVENNYLLTETDYLLLMAYICITFVASAIVIIVAYKQKFNFKVSALICLGASIILVCSLYFCPQVVVAILIFSSIQVLNALIELNMTIGLSGLLPTNIRSTFYGISSFFMFMPLTVSPYLIQVLSKDSQQLVTSVTLGFVLIGFTGAIIIPREIYSN